MLPYLKHFVDGELSQLGLSDILVGTEHHLTDAVQVCTLKGKDGAVGVFRVDVREAMIGVFLHLDGTALAGQQGDDFGDDFFTNAFLEGFDSFLNVNRVHRSFCVLVGLTSPQPHKNQKTGNCLDREFLHIPLQERIGAEAALLLVRHNVGQAFLRDKVKEPGVVIRVREGHFGTLQRIAKVDGYNSPWLHQAVLVNAHSLNGQAVLGARVGIGLRPEKDVDGLIEGCDLENAVIFSAPRKCIHNYAIGNLERALIYSLLIISSPHSGHRLAK